MKRWICLLALAVGAAAVQRLPNPGTDVSDLHPVGAVRLEETREGIRLTTDTGLWGVGPDAQSALENLRAAAPGKVFLESAEYALADNRDLVEQWLPLLRPSCQVCLAEGEVDLARVGPFLDSHPGACTLGAWRAGERNLPLLRQKEGRMELAIP